MDGDKIQCDCPNGFLGDRCEIRGVWCGIKYFFAFPSGGAGDDNDDDDDDDDEDDDNI